MKIIMLMNWKSVIKSILDYNWRFYNGIQLSKKFELLNIIMFYKSSSVQTMKRTFGEVF